jgi:hypothetical protein
MTTRHRYTLQQHEEDRLQLIWINKEMPPYIIQITRQMFATAVYA